jgi:hypothetical protein
MQSHSLLQADGLRGVSVRLPSIEQEDDRLEADPAALAEPEDPAAEVVFTRTMKILSRDIEQQG